MSSSSIIVNILSSITIFTWKLCIDCTIAHLRHFRGVLDLTFHTNSVGVKKMCLNKVVTKKSFAKRIFVVAKDKIRKWYERCCCCDLSRQSIWTKDVFWNYDRFPSGTIIFENIVLNKFYELFCCSPMVNCSCHANVALQMSRVE